MKSDKALWTRKAVGIIVILVVFLRLASGPLPIRVGFYILLLGQCVLIAIPRQSVRRPLMLTSAIFALCDVLFMVALGGPVENGAQLLWPIAVWIPSVAAMDDIVATILFILIGLVIVLSNNLASIASATEGLGLAAVYFGMRAARLQRMEHAKLVRAHRELEQATLGTMRHAAMAAHMQIARDMHDGVGHQLTSLVVQLEAMKYAIQNRDPKVINMNERATQTAHEALNELRSVVRGFEHADEERTLAAFWALVQAFETSTDITCDTVFDVDFEAWSSPSVIVVYRVLQEVLTNVTQHARARTVRILLREEAQQGVLTVEDDGHIVEIQVIRLGFGLRGMRDRCRAIGGTFDLYASAPHGLGIRVVIPIQSAAWEGNG